MPRSAKKIGGSLKGNRVGRGRIEPDLETFAGRLGARLRGLREKSGKTVDEVATALGVSIQTVYAYEIGTRDMPTSLIPKYATTLGVSVRSVLPTE